MSVVEKDGLTISLKLKRNVCVLTGIPEGQGRRALSWRLLLNCLPPKRSQWAAYLNQQRELYQQFLGKKHPKTV